MPTRFVVPGPPRGKERARTWWDGRRYSTYTPKGTRDYESEVRAAYIAAGGVHLGEGPITVRIIAYYQIPKSTTKTRRREMLQGVTKPTVKPDLDNLLKIILDSLNGTAYRDDKQVVQCEVVKRYGPAARVLVEIDTLGGLTDGGQDDGAGREGYSGNG